MVQRFLAFVLLYAALGLGLTVPSGAEKLALLIGIGEYPEPIPRLEGPTPDVEAMTQELIRGWGFERRNITTLVNEQATRAAILDALDALEQRSRPGDFLFIYYSGHGTSTDDPDLNRITTGLQTTTGALVPYDFPLVTPGEPYRWVDRLLVGSRDFRPRFERLDRTRRVFVVFDTCFSGNSVRSVVGPGGRSARWLDLASMVRRHPELRGAASTRSIRVSENTLGHDPLFDDPLFGAATATPQAYPYRGLIYIAAARKYERAEDIPAGPSTLDGRAHGALTNAILLGLQGLANRDGDRQLTYRELYDFARDQVSEYHPHTPQLLFPEASPELLARPVFDHQGAPGTSATTGLQRRDLAVRLHASLDHLRQRIDALGRVRVVGLADDYDMLLARERDGSVTLVHRSGDRVASGFRDRPADELLDQLHRRARAQDLIDLELGRDFDLDLDIAGRGFLRDGDRYTADVTVDRPAVLVLLNIDQRGTVSILHPSGNAELVPRLGFRLPLEVVPPFGTEYLKVFAFERRPAGLERWLGQAIDVDSAAYDQLLRTLESTPGAKAQKRLKVVTTGALGAPSP